MKRFFSFQLIPAIIIIVTLGSCKKFIVVSNPNDQVITSDLFSSDAGAQSAIAGLYSQMMNSPTNFANSGITIAAGLSADEIFSRLTGIDETHFYENSLLPSDEYILNTRLWSHMYSNIYTANAIIEGLNKSSGVTPSLKTQLLGEAKFLRAFHYFYLVNMFGDVPLVTSTDYEVNASLARTPTLKVYEQMIADLKEAENLLTTNYPSPQRLRPNKFTASALLARVYLYRQDWNNAEAQASGVINSGQYSLLSNLDAVFLPSSNEVIWQLLPVAGTKTPFEAQTFLPSSSASSRPQLLLTAATLNAFENGDQRKTHWVQSKTVSGTTYFFPAKYKTKTVTADPVEYNVVFRFAELFLIRTEARTQLANYTGAQSDLNRLRSRASLPPTTAQDKPSLLAAIEAENRSEFFAEWGHRWFDLKRWGRADAVLASAKAPNWQSTDVLYPIPLTEIKRNPLLTQNPGY
jgi:starch-binding outer membrane protein, SusD/RagB family